MGFPGDSTPCASALDWLLDAERPGRLGDDAPIEVTAHVRKCAQCQRIAARLEGLEQAYREASSAPTDAAREAFQQRLAGRPMRSIPRRPSGRRRWLSTPSWAIAASALTLIGAGALFLTMAPQAMASADFVDDVIDWNLDISQAASRDERGKLYSDRAAEIRTALQSRRLSKKDRELVETMLENGAWLAEHEDSAETAERFNGLADRLLQNLSAAAEQGSDKDVRRLTRQFKQVCRVGIETNLDKLEASAALNFERQRKLERMILQDGERMKVVAELLQRVPDASRKEIARVIGLAPKRPKIKKAAGAGAPAKVKHAGE